MKRILFVFVVFAIFGLLNAGPVFAQKESVEKAVQGVREKVDNLVTSKDENIVVNLPLRIEAFKTVVELSLAEAKDLKLKLLAIETEKDAPLLAWKNAMIAGLNDALAFYEKEQNSLIENDINSVEKIKSIAEAFKLWRDGNYLPVVSQISDFLLIGQEEKAIGTAEKRAKKIGEDLVRLAKINKNQDVVRLSKEAGLFIEEAIKLNKKAAKLFRETFLSPYEEGPIENFEFSSSSATSTKDLPDQKPQSTSTATSSASSDNPGQPDLAGGEAALEPSIRDLVRSSLSKVKETYQAFIEMSNLVRRLL